MGGIWCRCMYMFITGVSARTEYIYSYSDDISGVTPPLFLCFPYGSVKICKYKHATATAGANALRTNYFVPEIGTYYIIVNVPN